MARPWTSPVAVLLSEEPQRRLPHLPTDTSPKHLVADWFTEVAIKGLEVPQTQAEAGV